MTGVDEILGWKLVRPDLTTPGREGHPPTTYLPGSTVLAPNPVSTDGACPSVWGDGLCVARTIQGAQSGGLLFQVAVLVAYRPGDVLFDDGGDKIRVSALRVLRVVDLHRWVRRHGRGADLRDANLRDADLRDADLRGANLYGADLCGADLCGANLYDADLHRANLYGANLYGANLYGADLRDANLYGADLRDANLYGANLYGVRWDERTRWPDGFDPREVIR